VAEEKRIKGEGDVNDEQSEAAGYVGSDLID
jgi:hypothetical protein